MASKNDEVVKVENDDKELDDLLNSALEDLKKQPEKDEAESALAVEDKSLEPEESIQLEDQWSDEFIKQAAAQFESNMTHLLSQIPGSENADFSASMQQIASAAAQVLEHPSESANVDSNVTGTITETLRKLTEGTQNIQDAFTEDNLASMFSSMGLSDTTESDNGFLPFMQGMMQSLLSKEVLYPSLKDTTDKFPNWLEEHKDELEPADLERYRNQCKLMQSVCAELQTELDEDSADVKNARFNRVLELMQKLQDLGHPPKELVGDLSPGLPMNYQGSPVLAGNLAGMPTDQNQCNLM